MGKPTEDTLGLLKENTDKSSPCHSARSHGDFCYGNGVGIVML